MSSRLQHEFFFVGRDEGSFVENYAYDLGDSAQGGKIFISLEIQNNPAEAEAIGDSIFDSMRRGFFAETDKDPYLRFEESIKAVNKVLAEKKEHKVSKFIGNLHIIVAAIVGNDLFLTQCGDAEGYLIRRRLCSNVSEGLGDEQSSDVFTNIASGTLEPNDIVFLNSTRLLRYISKTDLAKICSGKNLSSSLADLKDFLATEVLSKIAIIAVQAQEVAPELSSQEKGQVVAHLQKEEFIPEKTAPRKNSSSMVLRDVVTKLGDTVDDLRQKVANIKPHGESIRGSGRMVKNKIIAFTILLVVLLSGSIWWLKVRGDEQRLIAQYDTMLKEVQEEVASAETTGQYNKDQAGQMLNHAYDEALEVLNSGFHRTKATQILESIKEGKDRLDGVSHPKTTVLADLSTKRQDISALGLIALDKTLYAYEYNALYPVVSDQVQAPLTIDENETVISATAYTDENSLLFYTKSGKVIEYKDGRMTFVDTSDPSFRKGVTVQAYSNKLYILDQENSQIWRYIRRRDKFDGAEAYNINADLKNGVSFSIDGNIYVLNKDGSIVKLFSGNKEEFPIKRQPVKALTNPTKIFTELDMNAIYILEPSAKRVLVYFKDEKTGGATYNNQFIFDDIADLRDIYVDKDTNKMYLMDASKIYTVNL